MNLIWWHQADQSARRALIAASLGWMLDAFDVMLYALVQKSIMAELHLSPATAGSLQSLTLLAAAFGGLIFGVVADRWGRTRALVFSVLLYSIFTAACGLASNVVELAVCRICLGIGMGGEWASGAALISETWPDQHRGKALGLMQSFWAIGYGLAAVVNWLVQEVAGQGWRVVFFIGVLPALYTLWVRRRVEEPELWRRARGEEQRAPIRQLVRRGLVGVTIALTLMNACCLFAWWGFNSWLPTYLSLPIERGGVGLSVGAMSVLVITMQAGMWLGYVTFGFISDAIGRRRTYVAYLLLAAGLVWAYTKAGNPWLLLCLGPLTAFFATGHFSGFGAVTAEVYPTSVRATAQGLTYNIGRIGSAFAPRLVGSLAEARGYPVALSLSASAFLLASLLWLFIPETKGRSLE